MCRSVPAVAAIVLVGSAATTARADPARLPVPEPIFSESVTDIDGLESGELEVSGDAGQLRARRAGAALQVAGVEAEWLATSRLGLRVEPSLIRAESPGASHTDVGVGTALAWKLVRDRVDDFYVQVEAAAEWPPMTEGYPPPDEAGLPFALDVRGAWRKGAWTMRGALGGAAGGSSPHVPLRGSVAVLLGFDRDARDGFFGIEALADGTWTSPLFVAPNVVADLAPLGLPVRVGLALPWSPSAGETQPSFGVYVRVMVEPFRDTAELL